MIRIISIVNMILNTMKKIGLIIKARVIVSNIYGVSLNSHNHSGT